MNPMPTILHPGNAPAPPSATPAPAPVGLTPLVALPDPEPGWLTGGPAPLFAWIHRPAVAPRGSAVLCPPLLGEHAAAYPVYRLLAASLATQGVTTIRFDYEGTGDSAGLPAGPRRVDAWLAGIGQAIDAVRQMGSGPMVLVGIRSSALLAATAAERRGDVDVLVLWDPWLSGRTFLRRQQALHTLQFPLARTGQIDVPGFTVDAATAETLARLRLPKRLRARHALVVRRPGEPAAPIALSLRAGGSPARAVTDSMEAAPGEQEALFEVNALERRMPSSTAQSVLGWITSTLGAYRDPAAPTVVAPDLADRVVVATSPAGPIWERPVWLGQHRLFGVETETDRDDGRRAATVLFLTSGSDSHVGPSRLWVELARQWAGRGVRCVRIDLSGWGDTAARPGSPGMVLRPPAHFDDVAEAVDALGGPKDIVLVGLCSGAYQALDSALELGPLGVCAVNPLLRFTPPELLETGTVAVRRRICEPRRPWVRSVRSKVPQAPVRFIVEVRRALRRRAVLGRSWLDELATQGVAVYCLCGREEAKALPPHDPTSKAIVIEEVPNLDHALLAAGDRTVAAERLTVALGRMLDRRSPTPTPTAVGSSRYER